MSAPRFLHATPAFRTFCGADALDRLPRELDRLGAGRMVVVCGASMVRRHGSVLERVESSLGDRFAGRFDGVQEHSPVPSVEAARDLLGELGADGVLAVGGGSAIVTARAAVILHAEGRDVRELCTRRRDDGRMFSPRLEAPKLPQWIVPTTPTTAYAKAGAAIRAPETGERLALFDPKSRAQGVFLEPEVALTAPGSLVVASGLNAFATAVESLQAGLDDPLAEALLAHALRMLARWIPRLADAEGDPEARLRLMLAALLCGQGSDYIGGGLAQALSHAAGPRSSVSNGVVEALLLPHTMRFTAGGMSAVARALDVAPEETFAAVEGVLRAVGVPSRLRDVGVDRDALAEIAAHAEDDWSITRTPRPPTGDELRRLLDAAW